MELRPHKGKKVDISAYISACELNFIRFNKLLPRSKNKHSFELPSAHGRLATLEVSVTERCKYMNQVTIEHISEQANLANLSFQCRVYFDAKVLEVVSFQQQKTLNLITPWQHKPSHSQDEKMQQQQFLAECLQFYLAFGLGQHALNV